MFFDVIALEYPLKLKACHNFTNQLIEIFITLKKFINMKCIYIYICGVQEFKKVFTPRVIPMAEEATITPRRLHTQTIRPHQWHVTRGGHIVEKEFWEGG